MDIFQVIFHNFATRSRTRKPEDSVPFPVDFRGELVHATDQCVLCETCVYVCSPVAITTDNEDKEGYWQYDGGRCTFCGRCVEYCPTHALSFLNQSAPTVNQRSSEYKTHIVEYQHCKRCGALIIPLPYETLVRLYHSEEAAQHAVQNNELCERCRSKVQSEFLKSGISGNKN
jgi:formate hydrogenlyase subunit 6/NADH:ubiquinone oxidoreductase subunit I